MPEPQLERFCRCRDCGWKPDPKARASQETQANKHGTDRLHVVEYGMARLREDDDADD